MKKAITYSVFSSLALSLLSISSTAMAVSNSTNYPDTGKLKHSSPVNTNTFATELAGGGKYISIKADVLPKTNLKSDSNDVFTLANKQWTYTRGVGTVPNVCQTGYEAAGLMCKVKGASYFSKQIAMDCPEGTENSNGLCYKPCAESFKGFGPFCTGNLLALKPQNLSGDLAKKHAAAMNRFNKPGITLRDNEIPRIKTDVAFGKVLCHLKPGFDKVNKLTDKVSGDIIGKIDTAIRDKLNLDIKNKAGNKIWSVPSLNDFVAYDLSAKPTCTEQQDKYVATLDVDNSVTVKANTKIFDPLFHNLGGVDAGFAKVSIYELIPFRVYGSSGATLGTKVSLSSTELKGKPPFMVNNIPHAHQTSLKVSPTMNFWLGLDAYLRIGSIIRGVPDVLQVGGDVDLDIINWQIPYALTEGVTYKSGSRQLFIDESLDSTFNTGNGQAKPFLNIFGKEVKVFKDSDTKTWQGYQESKNLLTRKATY